MKRTSTKKYSGKLSKLSEACWICAICGQTFNSDSAGRNHFSSKHPVGYCFTDATLYCLICDLALTCSSTEADDNGDSKATTASSNVHLLKRLTQLITVVNDTFGNKLSSSSTSKPSDTTQCNTTAAAASTASVGMPEPSEDAISVQAQSSLVARMNSGSREPQANGQAEPEGKDPTESGQGVLKGKSTPARGLNNLGNTYVSHITGLFGAIRAITTPVFSIIPAGAIP